MSDQDRDSLRAAFASRESLVSSIEKLQEHQKVLAKYMAGMKRRLDDLSEQFNNRPELQQLISLQDALAQLHRQLDERSPPSEALEVANQKTEVAAWVGELPQQPIQVQSYDYQLVFDRSGSRAVSRGSSGESPRAADYCLPVAQPEQH